MTRPPISNSERARHRTGGKHDVRAGVLLAVDLDGLGADELAVTLDDRDAARLDESLKALVEAIDHAILVGVDGRHVDALERRLHAVVRAIACAVSDLSRVEQCFGRDASRVQAGATELALLDQRHGLAELHGAQSAGIAAASAAENHDVEVVAGGVRHGVLPRESRSSSSCHSTRAQCHRGEDSSGTIAAMGIFRGRKARTDGGAVVSDRNASKGDLDALRDFAESRKGVEGYIEPKTSVTQTTLLLVAADGESLRRRVASAQAAADFARKKLNIPVYDANLVGIPSRKREYDLRKAKGTSAPSTPHARTGQADSQGARGDHDAGVDRRRRPAADQSVVRPADEGLQAGASRPPDRNEATGRSGTRSRTPPSTSPTKHPPTSHPRPEECVAPLGVAPDAARRHGPARLVVHRVTRHRASDSHGLLTRERAWATRRELRPIRRDLHRRPPTLCRRWRVAVRRALVEGRAGDVEVSPGLSSTNSRRNAAANSVPPYGLGLCWRRSAMVDELTRTSSPRRSEAATWTHRPSLAEARTPDRSRRRCRARRSYARPARPRRRRSTSRRRPCGRASLGRQRQTVRQDETSLGVGVEDLDGAPLRM